MDASKPRTPAQPPSTASVPMTGAAASAGGIARISSGDLLAGAKEVVIEHNGVLYRLRHTTLGKLILTK